MSSECVLGIQVGESDAGKLQPDILESLPTTKADFGLKYQSCPVFMLMKE